MDGTRSLIEHFSGITDPRVDRRKLHDLTELIVVAIVSIVGGADSFDDIELFAESHFDWFKKFIKLENGVPSHDTFERVFARIDPKEFQSRFAAWALDLAGIFSPEVIAIDGQTLRGAKRTGQIKSPIHLVSAWASSANMVLAQRKVDEKSNEITAIPELLKILELKGAIVTIDAMGCQQAIAQQIVDKKGDYALGLKGNQGATLAAVEDHFSYQPDSKAHQYHTVEKGHGRIEERSYYAFAAKDVLDLRDWPGLKSVIKVVSKRDLGDKTSSETRYYISSVAPQLIEKIGKAIRIHWGIENSVHYVLDVTFKQDKSRVRNGNAAENFAVLRHIAMNILTKAPSAKGPQSSKRLKRFRAGWDSKYLESVMQSVGLEKSGI